MGQCRLYIGLYACCEAPVWIHAMFGRQRGPRPWNRLRLRLSDEQWFDDLSPQEGTESARGCCICEMLWRTEHLSGQSLVLAPHTKESFIDTMTFVTHVRLVPEHNPHLTRQASARRLVNYFDGNFMGHYVENRQDIESLIMPLRDSDCEAVFWLTSREDTCYYPTRVGNVLKDHHTPGVYPHWAGRDLHRMLDRGEDPLQIACDVAHQAGIRLYASYRRMTRRLPPHIFPLDTGAMLATRKDLCCVDAADCQLPHLSLCYPEVRQRMIDILTEQAREYPIDGVHLFFSRGVPFVGFETPFRKAFAEMCSSDPRMLPVDDERVWSMRSLFVLQLFRELRRALDAIPRQGREPLSVAVTVMNRPRTCAYFGLDIKQLVSEKLVNLLVPFPCHYLPPNLDEWRVQPTFVAEFVKAVDGTGVRVFPDCGYQFDEQASSLPDRAAAFYRAGAHGLQVGQGGVRDNVLARRLGNIDRHCVDQDTVRVIPIETVCDCVLDQHQGLHTCG